MHIESLLYSNCFSCSVLCFFFLYYCVVLRIVVLYKCVTYYCHQVTIQHQATNVSKYESIRNYTTDKILQKLFIRRQKIPAFQMQIFRYLHVFNSNIYICIWAGSTLEKIYKQNTQNIRQV
jgi:restriction endonuclease S subunit